MYELRKTPRNVYQIIRKALERGCPLGCSVDVSVQSVRTSKETCSHIQPPETKLLLCSKWKIFCLQPLFQHSSVHVCYPDCAPDQIFASCTSPLWSLPALIVSLPVPFILASCFWITITASWILDFSCLFACCQP